MNLDRRVPSRLGHPPALDGLRGLNIMAVMWAHLGLVANCGAGELGVDSFFVLSGFLITSLLIEEHDRGGIILTRFYARRALRLLPGLVVFLLVVGAVEWWLHPELRRQLAWATLAILFYVANWLYIHDTNSLWHTGSTWSLAVEEQFYLVWPVLLRSGLRWIGSGPPPELDARRRRLLGSMVVMLGGLWLWRVALVLGGASAAHLRAGSDVNAGALLIGCCAAMLVKWGWVQPGWIRHPWAGVVCAATALALAIGVWPHHRAMDAIFRPFFAVAIAGLILTALDETSVMGRLLSVRLLRGVGKISYAVYLWHPAIFAVTSQWLNLEGITLVAARIGLSLIAGVVSFVAIERPALRLKVRLAG